MSWLAALVFPMAWVLARYGYRWLDKHRPDMSEIDRWLWVRGLIATFALAYLLGLLALVTWR